MKKQTHKSKKNMQQFMSTYTLPTRAKVMIDNRETQLQSGSVVLKQLIANSKGSLYNSGT